MISYIIFMFIILAIVFIFGFIAGFLFFKKKARFGGYILLDEDKKMYAELNEEKYMKGEYVTFKIKEDA